MSYSYGFSDYAPFIYVVSELHNIFTLDYRFAVKKHAKLSMISALYNDIYHIV